MPAPLSAPAGPLNTQQVAQYHRDGFVVARGFLPAGLVAALAAEAEQLLTRADLMDSDNIRCRWQPHHETGECLFETFDPVIDLGPVCRRVATGPELLGLMEQLYGEPAHLFKDKLIFKPAGAKGYGLHQDYIAWPDFPRSFATVLVPIDAADETNGCTVVYPGLHHDGPLTPEDGDYHELPAEAVAGAEPVPLVLGPGDVAVFGGFTPHFSAPNSSPGYRKQLYLSYNKTSELGDYREGHYASFHTWLKKKYAEYGKTAVYFR